MTIFDSIKYPISDKPTVEELERLPYSIYTTWCIIHNLEGFTKPAIVEMFTIRERLLFAPVVSKEVKTLRMLIMDYTNREE